MRNNSLTSIIRKVGSLLPAPLWNGAKKGFRLFIPGRNAASGGYRIIANPNPAALKHQYEDTWKDSSLPTQQLKVNARVPKDTPVFQAAVRLMKTTGLSSPSVLEIGCSTGYYADVFKDSGLNVSYEGCDYSEAFVSKAKELHPNIPFRVEDATKLTYTNKSFDVAISGCCILHIIDYDKAVAETARVATKFSLFHRTPVLIKTKTTYAEKVGYGVPMVEIFFNEQELFGLFEKNGMRVVATENVGNMTIPGLAEPVLIKSYLCKII